MSTLELSGCLLLGLLTLAVLPNAAPAAPEEGFVDLRRAVVVCPVEQTKPERSAVRMLVEEVEKRTQVRWPTAHAWPEAGTPVIALGRAAQLDGFAGRYAKELAGEKGAPGAEGYRIRVKPADRGPAVLIAGADPRGVLFGVGHLLRTLRMGPQRIALPAGFSVTTTPKVAIRGHQLGYRPKTNSYDAWDLPMWEQYYRDLVIFGCNAVELIPPRSDDDADSPHFPLPPLEMMIGMSRLADDYGLDVWVWYPALDEDYSKPETVAFALKEWGEVLRRLPRLDAVFVPGGDPGHTPPKQMLALLEKQAAQLRQWHPRAQWWLSPQGFSRAWLDEFLGDLKNQPPAWLTGIVFGPQNRMSMPQLRAALPERYAIRHYPDITHSVRCQYPVPDWDVAYALTESREGINPRPMGEAQIFRETYRHCQGFLTYSEGCNDDVNKAVWDALGWDPDADVVGVLRDFGRYFIGDGYADDFAQGLLALERDWQGPLIANQGVETTLLQFRTMERRAPPSLLRNWRFQQALYRAYYDAYTRRRLLYETGLEQAALERLQRAPVLGSLAAAEEAEAILDRAVTQPTAPELRARIFELGEALFQSVRMQLSVPRYQAIEADRGANLDTLDVPLNNRRWLEQQFAELRALPDEAARLKRLAEVVEWKNPGPGGFYDDLGDHAAAPHLVRGLGFDRDPAFTQTARIGFLSAAQWGAGRLSWARHAESLFDAPLVMRYTGLDPTATYRVRVVYGGDSPRVPIRLEAGDGLEVHPLLEKPFPLRPVEFDLPAAATRSGNLTLRWSREAGLAGNGRGCQVSEVWVIKRPAGEIGAVGK